jgi:hypothetical protein
MVISKFVDKISTKGVQGTGRIEMAREVSLSKNGE